MNRECERSSYGNVRGEQRTAAERIALFESELCGDRPFDAIVGLFVDGTTALARVRKAGIEYLNVEDALLAQRAHRILNGAFRGLPVHMTAFQGQVNRSFTTAAFVLDSRSAGLTHEVGIAMVEDESPDADYTMFTPDGQGVSLDVQDNWRPQMTLTLPPDAAAGVWGRYVAFKAHSIGQPALTGQTG